jgi:LacI family transcriptional regulator
VYKKRVTLKDIAEAAGVSSTTVSVIINGRSDVKIGTETKIRVLNAAETLGYSITPPKKHHVSPIVCFIHENVVQDNIGTSFFSRVSTQLQALCEKNNLGFLEFEYNESIRLQQYQTILTYQPVALVSHSAGFVTFHENQKNGIPLFSLQGERLTSCENRTSSLYLVDDYRIGQLGAQHLYSQGYRSCGLIFPDRSSRCINERLMSFKEAFTALGGSVKQVIFNIEDHKGLEKWFQQWDRTQFDSFYFFSDAMAIPAIRGLQLQQCPIPEQAAVLGTDNLYWGQYIQPSLTTMNLHEDIFAGRIFDEVKNIVQGGKFYPGEISIPVDLIQREST